MLGWCSGDGGPSSRSVLVTYVVVVAVNVLTATQDLANNGFSTAELPFKAPCEIDNTEVVYPRIISTARWRTADPWNVGSHLPPTFHMALTWKGRILRLTLFHSDVAARRMVTVYEEEMSNATVADAAPDHCQYQGFLQGDRSSYAALSACDGLTGYIQTEDKMLVIEPGPVVQDGGRAWGKRPHLMYTCHDAGNTPGSNHTEAGHKRPPRAGRRPRAGAPGRRRTRRSSGLVKYLEVQLVVDHTVLGIHGSPGRVRRYVMTLMNIANAVYQHPSLGVSIRVVVTELIILPRKQQDEVLVKKDAFATVQKFCHWSNQRHSPSRAIRHDMALLLTREKLGPAGYAPITGMCNPEQACATVTDEGFTSGFIIAHEMAHVFGLVHDGQSNACSGIRFRSAIMAPLVEANLNHFWWSPCSKQRMQQVIPYLTCLNDNPDVDSTISNHYNPNSGHKMPYDPGPIWSLNFQCRVEFGFRFRLCPAFQFDACNVLWCSDTSLPYMCRTKRAPPVPGSNCGYNKECRNRLCVYVGRDRPVHGAWSSWGQWGDCSVRCGVGVKRRRRYCSRPRPANGGRECHGKTETWDTCLGKDCREYHDPRVAHCETWNERDIREGWHDWQPFQAPEARDRCKQTCVSRTTGEVVTIKVAVVDATPCDYDHPTDICVDGKCLTVGCDGVQGSNQTYDSCGICGGDHSQCKTVSGYVTRKPSSEDRYEPIVYLPKGSRNIEVVRRGKTKHFVALRDPERNRYLLNAFRKREASRDFIASGARFEYNKKYGFQSIRSRGPLYANLEVMLYPDGDLSPMSVSYEYSINTKDRTHEKHKFSWKHKEWSQCSTTCGEGITVAEYSCYDRDSGQDRDEQLCKYVKRPRKNEAPCFRQPCSQKRYEWKMTDMWSACSAGECGQEGLQTQEHVCHLVFVNNDTRLTVDSQLCQQVTLPQVTRNCSAPPCSLSWSIEPWSQCSVTCGRGEQTRRAYCGDPDTDSDDVRCQDALPSLSRPCAVTPCKDQHSSVKGRCRDKLPLCRQSRVLSVRCHSPKFHKLCCRSCQRQYNSARTPRHSQRAIYRWVLIDTWDRCRARQCEEMGVQTQRYVCQVIFRHNNTQVPVSMTRCHRHTAPLITRQCVPPACRLAWDTGAWTPCSVTCGRGEQTRNAFCGDPDTDSDDVRCQDAPPSLSRPCVMIPCKGKRSKRQCRNKYSFCARSLGLDQKCRSKRFRRMCCRACRRLRKLASRKQNPDRKRTHKKRMRKRRY